MKFCMPNLLNIVEAYLEKEFPDKCAIVFHDALDHISVIHHLFPETSVNDFIDCACFITECFPDRNVCEYCKSFAKDVYGYVSAWDGKKIVMSNL
jgi:hypothetical protein